MDFSCLEVCGQELQSLLRGGAETFAQRTGQAVRFTPCEGLPELYKLAGRQWDAVFVGLPGAEGMEAANCVRETNQQVPLIWISDDKVFGIHSYRLRAQMFLCLPVTEEEIAQALLRCTEKTKIEWSVQ